MSFKKCVCFFVVLLIMIFPLTALGVSAENDENLALNKGYTIEYDSPIENGYPKMVHNENDIKLTDGKKANLDSHNSAWFRLYRGTKNIITLDLEDVCAVKSVSIGQLQLKKAGIMCSRYVYVAVSEDGEKFATVGSVTDKNSVTSENTKKITHNVILDNYYRARYVRLTFSNDVFTYNDEIEVMGSEDVTKGVSAEPDPEPEYINAFPTDIDGVKNIVLMYCGDYNRGENTTIGKITEEELLPYFAYVDKSGQPEDTMFDSMLFLPLHPVANGSNNTEEYSFGKKTGWEIYIKSVMGKDSNTNSNTNIAALDNLVEEYGAQLGISEDYKYPVYISCPFIHLSDNEFGEINGEMITPSSFESRDKIVKWFVDLIISSFNEADFKNVKLNGIYWHDEVVSYGLTEYEDELIKSFNEYVDTKGLSSIWIPYYCAPGYETWKELGFDAAVLQSGYAFGDNEETGEKFPEVVDDTLAQAKKYGLGMEIETSGTLTDDKTDGFDRYYKYLHSAYSNGLMENGLCMYYQGGGPGAFYNCAKTSNPKARMAYDLTYRYINKTFTSYAPVIEEEDIFIILNKNSKISCNLPIKDEDTANGFLKTVNLTAAQNIKMSVDGPFVVLNASDDFVGEDSFSFQVSDGFNQTDLITVKVLVVEDSLKIKDVNSQLKENSAVIYDEQGQKTGTEDDAFEVVVDKEGKISNVGGFNNSVPDGGYIVAAIGSAQEYLKAYAKEGRDTLYDKLTKTFTIMGEKLDTDSNTKSTDLPTGVIIGAGVLVIIGISVFVIIKKSKKERYNQ